MKISNGLEIALGNLKRMGYKVNLFNPEKNHFVLKLTKDNTEKWILLVNDKAVAAL